MRQYDLNAFDISSNVRDVPLMFPVFKTLSEANYRNIRKYTNIFRYLWCLYAYIERCRHNCQHAALDCIYITFCFLNIIYIHDLSLIFCREDYCSHTREEIHTHLLLYHVHDWLLSWRVMVLDATIRKDKLVTGLRIVLCITYAMLKYVSFPKSRNINTQSKTIMMT